MDSFSKSFSMLILALAYLLLIFTPSKSESKPGRDNFGFVAPLMHRHHPNISALFSSVDSISAGGGVMSLLLRGPLFMIFRIGTPTQRTAAVVDTASDVTWLQSDPCEKCYNQEGGGLHYDSRKSFTYSPLRCGEEACRDEHYGGIGTVYCSKGDCVYHVGYGNGLTSYGILGRDTFRFRYGRSGSEGRLVSASGVVIGRGIRNDYPGRSKGPAGVVGLTQGPYKFLDSLGVSSFSHCIPPGVLDAGYIKFGSQSNLTGQAIPFLPDSSGKYRIGLLGMTVSGVQLDIPKEILDHGVLIDTGMTITRLQEDAFNILLEVVKKMVSAPIRQSGRWELCYDTLEKTKDVSITFNFPEYEYELSVKSTWFKMSEGFFCLACVRHDRFILGAYHMLDINFGYDLDGKQLYLQKTTCEIF